MIQNPAPADTKDRLNAGWLAVYRAISLGLAVVFAGVGLLFLLLPGSLLRLFNDLSVSFGLSSSSIEGINFYIILAVGYMYVVALLAWLMSVHPEEHLLPVLLLNAKLASSLLSFVFFFYVSHALIYLVNGLVDGLIGAGVFLMDRRLRRLE